MGEEAKEEKEKPSEDYTYDIIHAHEKFKKQHETFDFKKTAERCDDIEIYFKQKFHPLVAKKLREKVTEIEKKIDEQFDEKILTDRETLEEKREYKKEIKHIREKIGIYEKGEGSGIGKEIVYDINRLEEKIWS